MHSVEGYVTSVPTHPFCALVIEHSIRIPGFFPTSQKIRSVNWQDWDEIDSSKHTIKRTENCLHI
jgi:hypothetical protein